MDFLVSAATVQVTAHDPLLAPMLVKGLKLIQCLGAQGALHALLHFSAGRTGQEHDSGTLQGGGWSRDRSPCLTLIKFEVLEVYLLLLGFRGLTFKPRRACILS